MGILDEGGRCVSLIGFQGAMMALGAVGPVDPYYANVSLLLHCDGVNGGTSFPDNSPSPKTPTVYGSAITSTADKKFGTASLYQSTTGDRLGYSPSADFAMGTGDWTIEMWSGLLDVGGRVNNVIDLRAPGYTGIGCFIGGGSFGQPPNVIGCSSNSAVLATGGDLTGLVFPHIAWSRQSGTIRAFINGVQVFSVADSRDYGSSSPLTIGADGFGTSGQVALGYMDEIRITKGVARYTANFTPPSSPFPDS